MIRMTLSELEQPLHASLMGDDVSFSGVSSDTRQIQQGDLFVALKGENFDGHDYVHQAIEAGAVAALVSELTQGVSCLLVDDTRIALGEMAGYWRDKLTLPVVGITGSNGKTTVKDMLAVILKQHYSVLATQGNLNNDLGVPLTLLSIRDEEIAVIEMGANHADEIAYLSQMAKPNIALLNNAGRAHLEGFGSLKGVAKAKAEIVQGLSDDGVFVFPEDTLWTEFWREIGQDYVCVTFGLSPSADVYSLGHAQVTLDNTGFVNQFTVHCSLGELAVKLPLMGEHNRLNALAAIAVAIQFDVSLNDIQTGLASLDPAQGRLQLHQTGQANIIDDSYNANPDSVRVAIDVLATLDGRRFLILGELAEMGHEGIQMYHDIGQAAALAGIEHVYVLGDAKAVLTHFPVGGKAFSDQDTLIEHLQNEIAMGDYVLVKGSRRAGMEKIVQALVAEDKH